MDIDVIAGFAYVATLLVFVFGILTSASHLVFSGIRLLRNRPSGFSWIIGGRWISVAVCVVWCLAAVLIAKVVTAVTGKPIAVQEVIVDVAIGLGLVPLLILPVVLPLFEIWRYGHASSMTLAALSVVAFPVVFAMTVTGFYSLVVPKLIPPLHGGISLEKYENAQLYEIDSDALRPQGLQIAQWLNLPQLKSSKLSASEAGDFEKQRAALWLNMALCDISMEYMHDSGSTFSQLAFNHDSRLLSFLPGAFRIAYVTFFWAVVLLLLNSLVRRTIRTLRQHVVSPVP